VILIVRGAGSRILIGPARRRQMCFLFSEPACNDGVENGPYGSNSPDM
jgi:hypothetical protein